MDFTNINDPAGVRSLLDQLRASQAWQDTLDQPELVPSTSAGTALAVTNVTPPKDPAPSEDSDPIGSSSTVASLLSQLQSSPAWSTASPTPPLISDCSSSSSHVVTVSGAPSKQPTLQQPPSPPPSRPGSDLRSYTFQQALPHLAGLFDDPAFVTALSQMKQQQADLEKRLWSERQAIRTKHEERVRVAQARARIFGASLSKHEADMLSDAYKKELKKFDAERVLVAWDGLVAKQQTALENLQVPAMFKTDTSTDRERQQRVIQVLEGIASS